MFSTVDQFFNEFRIQNDQFPNETVLNRGTMRLKREIRELKSLVDVVLGKEIEPWHDGKVYEIDEYVSYNGIIYRSNLDSNVAQNPQTSGFWDQQDIESIKSKNQAFKYIEYTSDGVQREFLTPFKMDSTPAVFVDGRLISPTKFEYQSNKVVLESPAGNLKTVTIIAGLSYEAVTVRPKQVFVAEKDQWRFETRFNISSPAVFRNGLYLTDGYEFGTNAIEFVDPVKEGDVICVVNGSESGIDLYSKQDIDLILDRYYDKESTYTKAEVDSSLENTKNVVLNDPSLAKADDVYTKVEVDQKLADFDVTDQLGSQLDKKADKAKTLLGYGITDAYDKGTVDLKLQDKLNAVDFNSENILVKIRDAEGPGTGLNADSIKGIKPEQLCRRDVPEYMSKSLMIKGSDTRLDLVANGKVEYTSGRLGYDYLNELNAKGSVIIVEGDFKGTWWDNIKNFGVLEPELYNWVVEVRPVFAGRQFDFVPKTYGEGLLFTAFKEKSFSGMFNYGYLEDDVVKLYSYIKINNEKFQPVPARYVLKGYRKNISTRLVRNQGEAALTPNGFVWNPDTQTMSSGTPEVPKVTAPDVKDDNALKIITEAELHEQDNTTNVIQSSTKKDITLQWEGYGKMKTGEDYWIRVTGGLPNQPVNIKIANGALISSPASFDHVGDLLLSVRGSDPLEYTPTITITSARCNKLIITPVKA